jgi:hypothetical protein
LLTLKISITQISKPIFSQVFFHRKMPFFVKRFLKSHGGSWEGMKRERPLGLYNPKTFSYWDLKNFNILNLITIFQWFLLHPRWILGSGMVRRSCELAWILSWVWSWLMPSLKIEIKNFRNHRLKHFQFEVRCIGTYIHPSRTYYNHSEPNIFTQVGSRKSCKPML